jgi:hypothetical protein
VWSSEGGKLPAYTVSTPHRIPWNLITIWKVDGQIFREIQSPNKFFFVPCGEKASNEACPDSRITRLAVSHVTKVAMYGIARGGA